MMYRMNVWQVCAGLYPNIVRVEEPAAGGKPAKGPPKPPKLFTQTVNDPKSTAVSIHPCSVNYNRAKFPTKWMVRPHHISLLWQSFLHHFITVLLMSFINRLSGFSKRHGQ